MIYTLYKNKTQPPHSPDDLTFTDKTIIVTGSNTGLGLEAANKFAAQGCARLILAVRSEEKGERVRKLIQHVASDPKCKVEVWKLDMLDYDSIRAFVKRCETEISRLDIAVLNAGVFSRDYKTSAYGWEHTLQVNVLSTAALAILLLPKLKESKTTDHTPLLEIVGSGRHYHVKLTEAEKNDDKVNVVENFNAKDTLGGNRLYTGTKLLLMYVVETLAKQVPSSEVLIQAVCPGACASELARDMDGIAIRAAKVAASALVLRTAEEGSRTLVSGTNVGEKGHGRFWRNDIIQEPAPLLQGEVGERLRKKVWGEVVDAVGKDVPEIRDLVQS